MPRGVSLHGTLISTCDCFICAYGGPRRLIMHPSRLFLPILTLFCLVSCDDSGGVDAFRSEGGSVSTDIRYCPGIDDDLLDVYVPAKSDTGTKNQRALLPVIMWIHGGGWRWGTKDNVPVLKIAKAGFALVSINYRLDGHAKYPAQINDCRAALAWLKQNGTRYGLDTGRIGIIGASAGGHLAALLGTSEGDFPELPKIRAVCALYPPTDLISIVPENDRDSSIGLVPLLLGGPVNEKKNLAWDASPVKYVTPDDPPFFLIHGQLDTLVPVQQSIELNDALLKAGVPTKLKICPDQKHGFYPDAELTSEIVAFFGRYLGSLPAGS